jgi:hypothetical protein
VTRAGPAARATPDTLVVIHALYGDLTEDKTMDVTAQVESLVHDGSLNFTVTNRLFGRDPAPDVIKEFKIDYVLNGHGTTEMAKEDDLIDISGSHSEFPDEALQVGPAGDVSLEAWQSGIYSITTAQGATLKKEVAVAAPTEVAGSWDIDFPPKWGAPPSVTLDHLISWSDDPDPGVKYFSGTATYHKTLEIPPGWTDAKHRLYLDLGNVQVIAQVKLNGQDLGVLWKPPYRADITSAARAGDNELEVEVTNLWPNRRIGDEQLPEDCEWNGDNSLKAWPQWLLDGKPSPTGRFTFATWRHQTKDSPLLPSGLIGPVRLIPSTVTALP